MIRNEDGSITLTAAEGGDIDALIASLDRHSRSSGAFTNQQASEFARQWAAFQETPERKRI